MSEILGVLFKYLLAMLAIVAVVAVLYEALGSSNTTAAISDISQIQANVYQLYSATPNSTTVIPQGSAAAVIGAGVVPSGMESSTSSTSGTTTTTTPTIVDPWGNQLLFTPAASGGGVLALTFSKVPLGSCAKLAVGAAKAGAAVTVGAATTPLYPSDSSLAADAAAACGAASGSTVAMTFNFYPSSGASNAASAAS